MLSMCWVVLANTWNLSVGVEGTRPDATPARTRASINATAPVATDGFFIDALNRVLTILSMAEMLTIEALEEWVRAGAHWRVVRHCDERAVVELQQCTGEPVERVESDDPAVIDYLRGVGSDEDLA